MKLNQATLFLTLVSVLLTACGENKDLQSSSEAVKSPTVLVSHPQSHSFNAALQITGTAKANQAVKLYAMTRGFLQQLQSDIGDFVKQGQTLAMLANPELYSRKAMLDAELQGKKSIYARLKKVYKTTPQLTTIADVEKARAEYQSTRAQLDGILLQISFLTVKAPFSGVITRRYADQGALIQSGMNETGAQPLFELQDIQTIRVQVDVPETNVAQVNKQTQAEITFPELPDTYYSATVSRMAYGLDDATKTMRVEIDIANDDFKLRPGMYAKVEMQNKRQQNALTVPNEAIGNIKGQSFVYSVNNGIIKKVKVKTGLRDEHYTELLNAAIKATDSIVIRGKELISDGATVTVKSL